MANLKKYQTPPLRHVKSLFLGVVFVASSVTVIAFSQSGMVLSSNSECCSDVADNALPQGHFSRANFTASANEFTQKDGLFWNPLAKTWLTQEQMELLQLAYTVGFEDGGHEHAEILQAILMQETIAGLLGRMGHLTAPVGKRSYGVMQVKVIAARDVLNEFSEFGRFRADEELIVKLLSDDEFNLRVASKFLLQLSNRVGVPERALVAYNIGMRASYRIDDPTAFKYVLKTKNYLEEIVRPFNHRFGDEIGRAHV